MARPPSETEGNKEVVRRCFAAAERGDVETAVACWSPDAINVASGRPGVTRQGRDAIRHVFETLRIAFPDRRNTIDDIVAEGDRVVIRMTVSGTFGAVPPRPSGPLPSPYLGVESTQLVPPSAAGRPYSVTQIHIFRMADGFIAQHWAARDDLSLLLQLGAVTPK